MLDETDIRYVGRIPLRNIWFLLLYASGLAKFRDQFAVEVEESPELPDLVGRLLVETVERRLRRNLSRGYRARAEILTRVRGRIDTLKTEAQSLLLRGEVACRYEELTVDTPRNRLVRAALDRLAPWVSDRGLSHACRQLAGDLGRFGVSGQLPTRAETSLDRLGRNDASDALMVSLARLVFDLVLPSEEMGQTAMSGAVKDEFLVRQIFEKAVGAFLAAELKGQGWRVEPGKKLRWQIEAGTEGVMAILPGMQTDIFLENSALGRRIVVDTKFTSIFTQSVWKTAVLKSGYLYQLYAYLRSQVRAEDDLSLSSEGILLHPAVGGMVDETVSIQGHKLRFMTVDLHAPTPAIVEQLRCIAEPIVFQASDLPPSSEAISLRGDPGDRPSHAHA
jgi:5-methylcytosine-specific restriction enzyme subunit McrC